MCNVSPVSVFAFVLAGTLACAPDSRPRSDVVQLQTLASPASSPSRVPRLGVDLRGQIHLSWVEERETAEGSSLATLRFSVLSNGAWTPARTAASGPRWFVNWADFPALAALDGENLVAHFLERSADGHYDYHVRFVRSSDGGATWSPPARLHADEGAGEHGFVAWTTSSSEEHAAVWLDGRNTSAHGAGGHDLVGHAAGVEPGAMALYTRTVRADGVLGDEVMLDDRVCDCCQTAAVRAADGALLVAYRDRSSDEVRDISVVRLAPGQAPKRVWASGDGWKIVGCPVNGPVLAAAKNDVGLAWFTLGSDGKARVLCAFSNDAGRTFSKPTQLAGESALGRVDAVFDARGQLVVTWLDAREKGGEWRIARVGSSGRVFDDSRVVGVSSGRESGLARLAATDSGIVFAYVDSGAEPRVTTLLLDWNSPETR